MLWILGMLWILIYVSLTVSPLDKQIPDLKSCQQEASKLYWVTPVKSKAICIQDKSKQPLGGDNAN